MVSVYLVLLTLHYYEVRTEKSIFFCFQENTIGNLQKVEITEGVTLENYRSCYGTALLQVCFSSSLLTILKMRELTSFDKIAD